MNSNPLISIVIANYNYGRFIGDAIRSVLAQDFTDYELIIVDGGSDDESLDVLRTYAGTELSHEQTFDEKGCHVWHICENLTWISEKDNGQSDAFNKGFGRANGRYYTWLNADDIFAKGALAAVANEMIRHPDCPWFVGSSMWCDSKLRIKRVFRAHRFSWLRARWGFLSAEGPSSFFLGEMLRSVGGVDEGLHYVMDIDLWHKFYYSARARYRRTVHDVWVFRIHEDSKLSGADVSESRKAIENRRKAKTESALVSKRYNKPRNWKFRWANRLSVSIVDNIVSFWRTYSLKGQTIKWYD